MKFTDQEVKILAETAQANNLVPATILKGMAVMIAEYEVLKARLAELGEVTNTVPCRWVHNNEPIVDMEEVIRKHQAANK